MFNTFEFVKTLIDWDKMVQYFGNEFNYVAERPYHDKKGKLPDGVVLTLKINKDDGDYGINKDTGKPKPTNRGQNIDVTILNGKISTDLEYDDKVSLVDFDQENSFAIGFDLMLRFKDYKKVQPVVAQPTKTTLTKGI